MDTIQKFVLLHSVVIRACTPGSLRHSHFLEIKDAETRAHQSEGTGSDF